MKRENKVMEWNALQAERRQDVGNVRRRKSRLQAERLQEVLRWTKVRRAARAHHREVGWHGYRRHDLPVAFPETDRRRIAGGVMAIGGKLRMTRPMVILLAVMAAMLLSGVTYAASVPGGITGFMTAAEAGQASSKCTVSITIKGEGTVAGNAAAYDVSVPIGDDLTLYLQAGDSSVIGEILVNGYPPDESDLIQLLGQKAGELLLEDVKGDVSLQMTFLTPTEYEAVRKTNREAGDDGDHPAVHASEDTQEGSGETADEESGADTVTDDAGAAEVTGDGDPADDAEDAEEKQGAADAADDGGDDSGSHDEDGAADGTDDIDGEAGGIDDVDDETDAYEDVSGEEDANGADDSEELGDDSDEEAQRDVAGEDAQGIVSGDLDGEVSESGDHEDGAADDSESQIDDSEQSTAGSDGKNSEIAMDDAGSKVEAGAGEKKSTDSAENASGDTSAEDTASAGAKAGGGSAEEAAAELVSDAAAEGTEKDAENDDDDDREVVIGATGRSGGSPQTGDRLPGMSLLLLGASMTVPAILACRRLRQRCDGGQGHA